MPGLTHLGRLRTPLAVLLLIAATSAALAFGLGEGNRFGRLGAMNKGGTVTPPPPGCSGTGLDFTQACNSQYIGII